VAAGAGLVGRDLTELLSLVDARQLGDRRQPDSVHQGTAPGRVCVRCAGRRQARTASSRPGGCQHHAERF
jgi:hypothetical protein